MKNYRTIVLISIGLIFVACNNVSPSLTANDKEKEVEIESDIPPACRTTELEKLTLDKKEK
ncbi:MAG: Unknown protein [uncultured Sulfurovum sp.]|uniref:Lipoprotein n=1 Tax=uncultured Sulfurovum sp. TaxID=269237 RepID=A0A6S6TW94_9BACT|nr:MAG: Unknown protein [uncultured Sulfurovum sp.]